MARLAIASLAIYFHHRVAMSVCLYVTKIEIIDNGQSIRFFVFLHNIEWLDMALRILNLEGYQNCMICLKVTIVW